MDRTRDQRAANVAYYARNRSAEIARVRVRQDDNLALLRELRRVPCADCTQHFEPFQMDFDHRDPVVKSFRLTSPTALGSSRARLLAEVAKCDVVCAVCHRIRTRAQHRERLRNRLATGTSKGLEQRRRRWTLHAEMLDDLRRGPMRRLWRAISALRDGFRPSRRDRQADWRDADGRTSRDREDPRRGRQVRYRVCELPSGADVSSAHERVSSGSSSVGGASAFQAECRGFESRLPLQFPRFGLSGPHLFAYPPSRRLHRW